MPRRELHDQWLSAVHGIQNELAKMVDGDLLELTDTDSVGALPALADGGQAMMVSLAEVAVATVGQSTIEASSKRVFTSEDPYSVWGGLSRCRGM